MNVENEEKGFRITDKRFSAKTDDLKETPPIQEKKPESGSKEEKKRTEEGQQARREKALPEINFITFVISLSSQAMLCFGDFPDPVTRKTEKNLPLAKQTIDILSMLQEKSKGNLNPEEHQLLENVLYELRMRYIKEVN